MSNNVSDKDNNFIIQLKTKRIVVIDKLLYSAKSRGCIGVYYGK